MNYSTLNPVNKIIDDIAATEKPIFHPALNDLLDTLTCLIRIKPLENFVFILLTSKCR